MHQLVHQLGKLRGVSGQPFVKSAVDSTAQWLAIIHGDAGFVPDNFLFD
jgi:hypothetical protein